MRRLSEDVGCKRLRRYVDLLTARCRAWCDSSASADRRRPLELADRSTAIVGHVALLSLYGKGLSRWWGHATAKLAGGRDSEVSIVDHAVRVSERTVSESVSRNGVLSLMPGQQ